MFDILIIEVFYFSTSSKFIDFSQLSIFMATLDLKSLLNINQIEVYFLPHTAPKTPRTIKYSLKHLSTLKIG